MIRRGRMATTPTTPSGQAEWRPLGEERGAAGNGSAPGGPPDRTVGAVELVTALPRLLGGALDDIRTIALGMRYLPELARTLAAIQTAVESMDAEVKRMRRGVDSMGSDVEDLAPRLTELHHAIPLRRLRRKG